MTPRQSEIPVVAALRFRKNCRRASVRAGTRAAAPSAVPALRQRKAHARGRGMMAGCHVRRRQAMHAMILDAPGQTLRPVEMATPEPGPGQVLVEVLACGVCRTDLHVVDGELPDVPTPIIPGHEIVGRVVAMGAGVDRFAPGDRVGIPWLGHTCGHCPYCLSGRENLCDHPGFTGYTLNGGYASHAVADAELRLSAARGLFRRRGGAAPLRRADRLPLAADGGRCEASRHLRLRRRGPHRRAGRPPRGTRGLRVHAARATGRRRPSPVRSARPGPAAPTSRRRGRSTPRSSSRRWGRSCRRR